MIRAIANDAGSVPNLVSHGLAGVRKNRGIWSENTKAESYELAHEATEAC